jgi:hypothetical protein
MKYLVCGAEDGVSKRKDRDYQLGHGGAAK